MSSYPKKRIDFSELDDHFDEEQHIDSLRYNTDIDSAVQIKKNTEPDKLNDVQQLLQYSPRSGSEKKKISSVRCSFGITSHFNPLRGSGNNHPIQQIQSPDTAQFPLQKNSIEELSAENEVSEEYSKEQKKMKMLTIDTGEKQSTIDEEQYDDQTTREQLEDLLTQVIQELEISKQDYQELQLKCSQQQFAIKQLQKLNQELTSTLDEQQEQLQKLSDTNGLLRKKIQNQKTYSTEQSQHHGSTSRNKENNNQNEMNAIQSISKIVNGPNEPSELVIHIKKSQKIVNTYSNIINMITLMIQKCFYLDEHLDKEGKEITSSLIQSINNKQIDNLVLKVESLIKTFEQRFANMVDKNNDNLKVNRLLEQIQFLINERPQ